MNDRKEKQRNYKTKIAYSYTIKSDYKAKTLSRIEACEKNFKYFRNLDEETRESLIKKAEILKDRFKIEEKIGAINYYNVVLNVATCDNNQDFNYDEAIALLIETIDPKLILLRLSRKYTKESEREIMSNRLFGFYEPRLIEFEREYAKTFHRANVDALVKKLEAARS